MKKAFGYTFIVLVGLLVGSCAMNMANKPSSLEQWRADQHAEQQILQNNLNRVKP